MSGVDGQGRPSDTVGVTARPVGDGDGQDGLRDRLADALEEALAAAYHYSNYRWPQQQDCPRIADALLPVVTAWAEQRARGRAAEELRAAAGALFHLNSIDAWAPSLRARADALAADDLNGPVPC